MGSGVRPPLAAYGELPCLLPIWRCQRLTFVRSGYQKLNQNVTQGKADHHEGIDFYASNPYKSLANSSTRPEDRPGLRPLEGENQWPTQMPHMKPRMEQWVDKMKILGLAVMEAMADGLGCTPAEKEDWRGMIDDSFWVMRMIGKSP